MTGKHNWQICVAIIAICNLGVLSQPARAIESQNTIMGIDAMVMNHAGLFRNGNPNDGFNTFQFGPILFAPGSQGRYKSFYFVKTQPGIGGINTLGRIVSSTPEHWNGSSTDPVAGYDPVVGVDLTSAYFPLLDRAVHGAIFNPREYQIEVKFKPNQGLAGIPNNQAATFDVNLDQVDSIVFDAEVGIHKRAAEQLIYKIGSEATPINTWYASAPKDADGFATWTVPITSPSIAQRSFYYEFGSGVFRDEHVVTGGGRIQNMDGSWSDVIDGPDFDQFGSPLSSLNAPNGLGVIGFSSAFSDPGNLSIDVRSIAVKKTSPSAIVARIDAHSGLTHRFGSGFTYGPNQPPINVEGLPFLPPATDQISRFDQNGMTNLMLNMRTPDNANEPHRFLLRDAPGPNGFDGTTATVNIRAKLLGSNTASSLTIVAKDLDGNDTAGNPVGADEYTYNLNLNQFNTSTFTTVSIPLSAFTLSTFVPPIGVGFPSTGPFGFNNPGDGSRSEFNLYEFGGLIPVGGGLLRMELEYLEIRVIPEPATAVMLAASLLTLGRRRHVTRRL